MAVPDTWLPGSDLRELAAWCCLGAPGLAYCAWRHALRTKHCPRCGGAALVREARASRRRVASHGSLLWSRGGPRWPALLSTPRQRLRRGGAALALLAAALVPPASAGEPGSAAMLGASWLLVQILLFHRPPWAWRAWDDRGRALDVELLYPR